MRKVFVEVVARFDTSGKLLPMSIVWDDGRTFDVDKILDVRQAASLKAGGQGMRYTCRICGKEVYLFYDAPKWFMEGKN